MGYQRPLAMTQKHYIHSLWNNPHWSGGPSVVFRKSPPRRAYKGRNRLIQITLNNRFLLLARKKGVLVNDSFATYKTVVMVITFRFVSLLSRRSHMGDIHPRSHLQVRAPAHAPPGRGLRHPSATRPTGSVVATGYYVYEGPDRLSLPHELRAERSLP